MTRAQFNWHFKMIKNMESHFPTQERGLVQQQPLISMRSAATLIVLKWLEKNASLKCPSSKKRRKIALKKSMKLLKKYANSRHPESRQLQRSARKKPKKRARQDSTAVSKAWRGSGKIGTSWRLLSAHMRPAEDNGQRSFSNSWLMTWASANNRCINGAGTKSKNRESAPMKWQTSLPHLKGLKKHLKRAASRRT